MVEQARSDAQAAQAAADKLATDVSIVDVSDRLAITDAFVLASAPNERQVQAIVDEVEDKDPDTGLWPFRAGRLLLPPTSCLSSDQPSFLLTLT